MLVHQDAEIVDAGSVRDDPPATLADPEVGVVGCAGAIGVRSIAWWEASVTLASFINRYEEHGGGDLHAFSWDWDEAPAYARAGEVETLDGFVLVLSPWAVRNVRFDESLGAFHGYDLDYCLQVREAGRKVVTADFRAIHHRPLRDAARPGRLDRAAHARRREVGGPRCRGIGPAPGTWRERALRAEAERDTARAIARSKALEVEARMREARARTRRDARRASPGGSRRRCGCCRRRSR